MNDGNGGGIAAIWASDFDNGTVSVRVYAFDDNGSMPNPVTQRPEGTRNKQTTTTIQPKWLLRHG